MPRIKLAYWHGGHSPGDEIDVSAEELAALQRDGRVAAVVDDAPGKSDMLTPEPSTAFNDSDEAEPVEHPPAGRKRR